MTEAPREDPLPIQRSDEEWRRSLTPEQYLVTREGGTERAFTGAYWDCQRKGTYRCVCCGAALFDSRTKYASGTGWPSFWAPIDGTRLRTVIDRKLLEERTEVQCRRCGAHLGHVFDDGPRPTGKRYCLNSAALRLEEAAGHDD